MTGDNVGRRMIENIELAKCTSCGICDDVCPADVIHMEPVPVQARTDGLVQTKLLPVIKFREHCITCFSCEIFCPEQIVDVHPSVKNRPRPW
jgi:Pyruvate/2-oxoacid:ferredoxin oxidoreductase delta subunit